MAQTISVNVPHKLGKAEARRRIEEGFGAAQQGEAGSLLGLLPFEKRWEGDRLHFEVSSLGQKLSARLDVLENAVQIYVDLPDLLAAIASRIKESLTKETVKALGHSKEK